MLRRQALEKAPAPAPDSGLGAAIDTLIQQRVDEALAGERERHAAQIRQLTEQIKNQPQRQLPPAPRTPAEPLTMLVHRDGADKVLWLECSDGTKAEVVRDGAGNMIAMREITESPVLPKLDIPFKGEARQYRMPRKLYGNDSEV